MRSLLNLDNTIHGTVINAIHDAQLDLVVTKVLVDTTRVSKVVHTLENICLDEQTIMYRQSILKDLMYNRTLHTSLLKECASMEKANSDFEGCKSQRSKNKLKSVINIADVNTSLRDYAYAFKKLIEVFIRLDYIFNENTVSSTGLKMLKQTIHRRVVSEGVEKLINLIDKIIISGQAFSYNIVLDDYLIPTECNYIICDGKYEGEKFSLFKKKYNNRVEINDKISEDNKKIVNDSYLRVVMILEQMFDVLFNEISYLAKDLYFYDFAIKLYDVLGEVNLQVCFPTVSTYTKYVNTKDIYLGVRYFSEEISETIYGNTLKLENNENSLVVGENNSGKTVFIRTNTINQIFAQTGLFVCADEAYFTIKNKIVTIFSGEEKDTNVGGRFEKEVIDIKEIIDEVDENSLVIINEIFQSTFALDGKNALLDILDYFTESNVKWITVTHLMKKTDDLGEYKHLIKLYETSGKEQKYKIKEIENV